MPILQGRSVETIKRARLEIAHRTEPAVDEFLNQSELARRWRLSSRTLERWRWMKCGRFVKIGKSVRYRREDVEAYERTQLRTIDGKRPISGNHRQADDDSVRSTSPFDFSADVRP
jgi:predicted DNA-binding transcriptional regulator AlpA